LEKEGTNSECLLCLDAILAGLYERNGDNVLFLNYHGDFVNVILSGSEGSRGSTRLFAIAESDK
jgi:hypothetical protein